MTWNDFLGFIISLGIFLFLMFRQAFKEKRKSEEEVEDYDNEEEELILPLRKKEVLLPLPVIRKKLSFEKEAYNAATHHYAEIAKDTKERYSGNTVVSSHYDELAKSTPYLVEGKTRSSRIHRILSQLKSKKDMVIFKEIIGPPKGL